mmetsp:Transcript_32889/g.48662  ORF Transcript_32889/g.48662 Transcript_32889/m.48662 type:complete len:557 (+) Transcript_32889:87-1757(+)
MEENNHETNQHYRKGVNYYRQEGKEGTKFQSPPSLLSLGRAEGNPSDLQREQDADDEILWDDNPNQKYASRFLQDRNINERGNISLAEIVARPSITNGPETIQFTESKASTSFATDEQSFGDYAGPSITPASLSTATSVLQVDVLDDTTEGIEVAKEDVPKDESTISRSIAFGNAPARHPPKPWPIQTQSWQGQDVPSVIYVSGIPQIIFKQDTAEDSVHGAASATSYRNMYTRKTIVILLSILIFVFIASCAVVVTFLLKNENNNAGLQSDSASVQFLTPTTAPTSKGTIDDSSFIPSNEIVRQSQSPTSTSLSGSSWPSYPPSSFLQSLIPSKAPSYTPTSFPTNRSIIPTATPSSNLPLAPNFIGSDLFNFINNLSENKTSLTDENSPQFKALNWLSRDPNLDKFTRYQKMQRYVMVTLFFSTAGNDWERLDQWLSYTDECTWFSKVGSPCNNNGILRALELDGNHLHGTIPVELSWLQGLERLFLRDNEFGGTIPSQLSRLSNLEFLQLTSNDLSGTLPTELARLTNLSKFLATTKTKFRRKECLTNCDLNN